MRARTVSLRVTLEKPEDVTMDQLKEYVQSSVASCKGGLDPMDPLFELDGDKVEVKRLFKYPRPATFGVRKARR